MPTPWPGIGALVPGVQNSCCTRTGGCILLAAECQNGNPESNTSLKPSAQVLERTTRNSGRLLVFGFLFATALPGAYAQKIALGEVADRAVAQSKLTPPGSPAFHLKARVAEKDNPDSDFKADVEFFWVSPIKWRRTIQSPDFSQTLIVNEGKIFEKDDGDYYPFWLQELVTALVDPLPMLEPLKQTHGQIAKPGGSEKSVSCARFESKVGIPPVENTAYSVYCFEGSHGLLESVTTPMYSVQFKNYEGFKDKRVAHLLITYPEPGVTIEAHVTELTGLPSADENLFAISNPTPQEQQLGSIVLSEADLRKLALQNPDIVWPSVRVGTVAGVLTMLVSIDKSGHVQETFR
jgi:hypothetical protein